MSTILEILDEVEKVKKERKEFNAFQDEPCPTCHDKRGTFPSFLCKNDGFHRIRVPVGG